MTISDSLPIKFYPTGTTSFNESDICGSFKNCYCDQLNYNEETKVQFIHSSALTLNAYDKSDDSLIGSETMEYLGDDFYQITFIPNVFIGSSTIKKIYFKVFAGATEVASTDCVTIGGTVAMSGYNKNFDLECSVTIGYTNSENFDNLLYEISPQPEFQIVIPATFEDENNPQTVEDIELSNGEIVVLNQGIERKKHLKIGYMPNDRHLALQKILMHDTIIIDGQEWRKRDSYESEPVNRYGLKKASVWLTLYNSVQNNTL